MAETTRQDGADQDERTRALRQLAETLDQDAPEFDLPFALTPPARRPRPSELHAQQPTLPLG